MATNLKQFKASEFLTAQIAYTSQDGLTEAFLWNDNSISVSQTDPETGQEHMIITQGDPHIAAIVAAILVGAQNVTVLV